SLFTGFIDFEHDKQAEKDHEFKEHATYLNKLRSTAGKKINYTFSMYSKRKTPSISIGNNSERLQSEERIESSSSISGRLIKRNLIIIEILENFLIDDGSENFIVDVEKLRMLLPLTMNVNKS